MFASILVLSCKQIVAYIKIKNIHILCYIMLYIYIYPFLQKKKTCVPILKKNKLWTDSVGPPCGQHSAPSRWSLQGQPMEVWDRQITAWWWTTHVHRVGGLVHPSYLRGHCPTYPMKTKPGLFHPPTRWTWVVRHQVASPSWWLGFHGIFWTDFSWESFLRMLKHGNCSRDFSRDVKGFCSCDLR